MSKSSDKSSENFVNVDPEYANFSNEVDRPENAVKSKVDHNLQPAFASDEQSEGDKDDGSDVNTRPEAGKPVAPKVTAPDQSKK